MPGEEGAGRRPSGPSAHSPLTSLPRMPLACFTVAFRQNTGFWRERRGRLSGRGGWAPSPGLAPVAPGQGYLELLDLLQHLLVLLGLHVEGLRVGAGPAWVRVARREGGCLVQAAGGGGGGGGPRSPPAGSAAAPRPPSRGWARASPRGAGRCREPPRRAGPAGTQRGHLRTQPPTTRPEPHQARDTAPPARSRAGAPTHAGAGGGGPWRCGPQPRPGRQGLPGGRRPLPSPLCVPHSGPALTCSGEKWWDGGSIWGARWRHKVLGAGVRAWSGSAEQAPPSTQPPAHLFPQFPQQASWGASPWAAFLGPRPVVAEVHGAQRPRQREPSAPGPPPFLPQRKQRGLSVATLAPQRRK